mgnify:CR=1 FL=1
MTELMVYGWASVATEHGVPVIDNGGDVIAPREMELAVTKYMEGPALARVMHVTSRRPAGVVLHSFPLTDEIKKISDDITQSSEDIIRFLNIA